ncbi:hypothetical protein J2S98_002351 [Arthrobacter oryzae]|nr:hypothetical protein [Arthrobacter oryzae]
MTMPATTGRDSIRVRPAGGVVEGAGGLGISAGYRWGLGKRELQRHRGQPASTVPRIDSP